MEITMVAGLAACVSDYAEWVSHFERKHRVIDPILGIVGEYGEMLEKFHSMDMDGALVELGDILWYLFALTEDLGADPQYIVREARSTATKYWNTYSTNIFRAVERIKKAMRECVTENVDDAMDLMDWDDILEDLTGVMAMVMSLCDMVQVTLPELMKMNMDKLNSRENRGVLIGEGDNR